MRNYHWLLATVAMLPALVNYIPASFLQQIHSDVLSSPFLFHDVVELGHPLRDWNWGGHSDIFPDLSIVFFVDFFLRSRLRTLQVVSCIMLVAYIAMLVALYRQCGGRGPLAFGMVLLLFFLLILVNFGFQEGVNFYSLLSVSVHTGTVICALGCVALCVRTAIHGGASLWWLGLLCFITGYSDDLFIVVFPAPMLVALLAARLLHPGPIRSFFPMLAMIAVACALGHVFALKFSPVEIYSAAYTRFEPAAVAASWRRFCGFCRPSDGKYFVVFVALDLLYLLFGAVFLAAALFKRAAMRIPLPLFIVLLFGLCVICCNWGAELLSVNFTDINATRQVRLAMLFPVFVLLGWFSHLAARSGPRGKWLAAAVSAAICVLSVAFVPKPGVNYTQAQLLAPKLRDAMRKERINAGLAGYWEANFFTFFLPDDLAIRSVQPDGSTWRMLTTLGWYAGDGGPNPPPAFRMILINNLDAEKIRRRYGGPDHIVPVGAQLNLWVYPPEKSIRYNPVFGELSNGAPDEYKVDGDFMASYTGKVEGTSRVAREGRDPATFITFGPFPYLHPARGRYRVTITYAYLASPRSKCIYDVICTPGMHDHSLDSGLIPYIDGSHREFTREFEITDDKRGPLQVRVQYPGSGDFSFDSLKITYLGK